jgi:hypothetical protein
MTRRIDLLAAALCVAACVGGCSRPDGRHMVSGRVTFDGAAVPVGEIVIEPDAAAGNRGPQARASIKDGRFQTAPRKGAIAGDVIVEVWGADGVATREAPLGKTLFVNYRLKMHLPAKASTLDIAIPRDASAGK